MGFLFLLIVCAAVCLLVYSTAGRASKEESAGLQTPRSTRLAVSLGTVSPSRLPSVNTAAVKATEPRSLESLSWQEFELLSGELFRRQGYTVQMCSGDGADGGVDLRLQKDGLSTLVQCKHWKVYKVGPSPVRELFGVLTAEGAHQGIVLTVGRFTRDAVNFAQGKPVELIDGAKLKDLMAQADRDVDTPLLDVATWRGEFVRSAVVKDPACPFCQLPMVLRQARESGTKFWGCRSFPRCRGKRNLRSELFATR